MKGLSGRLPILIFLGRRETEKAPSEALELGGRRRRRQVEIEGWDGRWEGGVRDSETEELNTLSLAIQG